MKNNDIYILHSTLTLGGGVGTVIKNLIDYQVKEGYKVALIYLDDGNKINSDFLKSIPKEVNLFPIKPKLRKMNFLFGLNIKKIYNKEKYKSKKIVFHNHGLASVGLLNNLKNINIVCTVHGKTTNSRGIVKIITNLTITKLALNKSCIVAVSDDTQNYYSKFCKKNYIKVVKNGIKINDEKVKQYKQIDKNKFYIGYASFIDELKGWRYLKDAYSKLSENRNMKLIFAGDGNSKDLEELEEYILDNIEKNIEYLGNVTDAGHKLVPNFDVLVLPSKSEGIPMVILEAIGNGVPVIATPVGGIPEVIEDGINGFIVSRNSKEIAEKIEMLYKDNELYDRISRNAKITYKNNFTVDKMCEKYLEIYRGYYKI